MTSSGYCAAIVVVLLIAGFRYAGWSPVILVAVLALLWFGLSAVISFASDRRYVRAFDHMLTHRKSSGPSGSLGIGRAIFIGELVVNLPAIGLLYEGTGHAPVLPSIVAVVVAFVASWAWWAIAAPRWLLWAMKRVVDPLALRNAVVGSIIWPNNRLGRAFNSTQWRTAAMKKEEQELVQGFVGRIRQGGVTGGMQ